jgi:hypothetical protein
MQAVDFVLHRQPTLAHGTPGRSASNRVATDGPAAPRQLARVAANLEPVGGTAKPNLKHPLAGPCWHFAPVTHSSDRPARRVRGDRSRAHTALASPIDVQSRWEGNIESQIHCGEVHQISVRETYINGAMGCYRPVTLAIEGS